MSASRFDHVAYAKSRELFEASKSSRRTGVFGSEFAAIMGCCDPSYSLSPWEGALAVFLRKVLPPEKLVDAPTLPMQLGTAAEPVILEEMCRRRLFSLTFPSTQRHPLYPEIGATPDGLVVEDPQAFFEAKFPVNTWDAWGDEGDPDGVPDYYRPQIEVCGAVTGRSVAHAGAIVRGRVRMYRVQLDPKLARAYIEHGRHFWHDHVLREDPPAPSAHRSLREQLAELYPKSNGVMLGASPDARILGEDYARAASAMSVAKNDRDAAKHALIAMIGDAEGIEGLCTYKTDKNGRAAWKTIAAELRDLLTSAAMTGHVPEFDFKKIVAANSNAPGRRWHFQGEEDGDE